MIVSRIKSLISFFFSIFNPGLFIYRLNHYRNKYVSSKKSVRIAKMNLKFYKKKNINILNFDTYDYSNQVVHPHMTKFKDKKFLILTPYPYGMEEYENPCIYEYNDSYFSLLVDNPIAWQKKHKQGNHLSDPCFLRYNGKLLCTYRSTERINNKCRNSIFYKELFYDDKKLGDEHLIIESYEDQLLSPAFINYNNTIYMICANTLNLGGNLKIFTLNNDLHCVKEEDVIITNLMTDYYVWHLDINADSERMDSLFLIRSKTKPSIFKLFLGHCHNFVNKTWVLDNEVNIPNDIKKIIKHPYKSSFVPDSTDILLSFKDKKSRYYFINVRR